MFDKKRAAAVCIGALGVGVAVQPRTHQTDEQRTGTGLAGVVGDRGDVGVRCTGVGNVVDKVV